MYWINLVDIDFERNVFCVYCDMMILGGGWIFVVKVMYDYSWVCFDRDGGMCLGFKINFLIVNLFYDVY